MLYAVINNPKVFTEFNKENKIYVFFFLQVKYCKEQIKKSKLRKCKQMERTIMQIHDSEFS